MQDENKTAYLMHYASKYYDPVKAHEYYMQHRQLKGRKRSMSALDEEGKEIWSVSKENITAEKKEKKNEAKESKDTASTALREKATATRKALLKNSRL